MTKPILKLGFADTFGAVENFFTTVLSEDYTIVRDDANPEFLIFGDRNFGNSNSRYDNRGIRKIFFTGENQRPQDYSCDYSITFDHIEDEKNFRLPLYVLYEFDNPSRNVPLIAEAQQARTGSDLNKKFKDKFCSFVVKNGGCQKRNEFFMKLSQYKRIDAAGPLFNNMGGILPAGVDGKIEFLKDYKFNMCFENSSHPGYATEKLFEAYLGKTIPIYWGSTTISCDFNTKAFLNWHDYQNDEAFINAIIEVDQNPEKYEEMYLQPLLTDYRPSKYMDLGRFRKWFKTNVFEDKSYHETPRFNYNSNSN